MLHRKIGEIFLKNDAEARTAFSNSLGRFLVPDRGTNRCGVRVVLLVESPHVEEVCPPEIYDRYPLAGSAGLQVRNKLMELEPELDLPEQPIGQLVREEHDAVLMLGIMNVSQLPLQKKPYKKQNNGVCQNQCWEGYMKCMKRIRKDPYVHNYQDGNGARNLREEINQVQCAIVEDLGRRLRCLYRKNPDVCLVRCGDVALAFHTKAWEQYLPHPSRNRWRNLDCRQGKYLRNIIECIRPP